MDDLFTVWVTVTGKIRARLDDRRRKWLERGIREWGFERAKAAVLGVRHSGFHMGENDRQKPYNEPEHVFRDAARTEDFIALHEAHSASGGAPPPTFAEWQKLYLDAVHRVDAVVRAAPAGGTVRVEGLTVPVRGDPVLDLLASNVVAAALVRDELGRTHGEIGRRIGMTHLRDCQDDYQRTAKRITKESAT